MTAVKKLARIIPQPLRRPVRAVWRRLRGNPEFKLLRLLGDREKISVDVGANFGVYTALMAGFTKACVAFEPNPPVAKAAAERASSSGLKNVQVHTCALSDRDTEVTFRVPIVNGKESDAHATIEPDNELSGREVHSYTVPCRRLDTFDLEAVGLMKIDAEGHETAILEGARKLIARDRPAVMIEVEERHKKGSVAFVQEYFSGFGYSGFFLMGRQLLPLSQFDLGAHQDVTRMGGREIHLDEVYVNNFIFVADERRKAKLADIARSGRSL